jgi:hypothetical protein
MVEKHHAKFLEYVEQYGLETVLKVLRTGRSGKLGLTWFNNGKDRFQMYQLLNGEITLCEPQ